MKSLEDISLREMLETQAALHGVMPSNPYDFALPPNPNPLGRPPTKLDLSDPEARAEFAHPDFVNKLEKAAADGEMDPEVFHDIAATLRQVRRVRDDARALPGDFNGDSSQPYLPMPFALRESRHPGYSDEDHDLLVQVVNNMDTADISRGLRARMRENDPERPDSTWNSMASPQERAERAAERSENSQPTLRESIEAAASVIAPQE